MVALPLWGMLATAILTLFMPLPTKDELQLAINLLQSFSQRVSNGVHYHLGLTGDAGRVPPPTVAVSSECPPVSPSMAAYVHSVEPWNGPNDLILISPETSLSNIIQFEKSLSIVVPFKVTVPKRVLGAVSSAAAATPIASTTTVPGVSGVLNVPDLLELFDHKIIFFLVCLCLTLGAFNAILIALYAIAINTQRQTSKQTAPTEKAKKSKKSKPTRTAKLTKTRSIKRMGLIKSKKPILKPVVDNLSKAQVVLKLEHPEPYLESFMKRIESQAEPSEALPTAGVDFPLTIIEYLFLEEEADCPGRFVSQRRWAITRSEFETAFIWSSIRERPASDPSEAVSLCLSGGSPNPQKETADYAIVSEAPAVVSQDSHVWRTSDDEERPKTPADIVPEDSTSTCEQSEMTSSVSREDTSDTDEIPDTPPSSVSGGFSVPGQELGETLTVVSLDVHVKGTSDEMSGEAPEKSVVVDDGELDKEDEENRDDLPLPTLSRPPRLEPGERSETTVTATVEDQSSVTEEGSHESEGRRRRRRRNRMGQRQRRKKRAEFEAQRLLAEEDRKEEEEEREEERGTPVGGEGA